ncbi:hypothetical protein GLOTRDRAFT_131604 [Gloeophyllum trabeum ATCC 11539]|uniref:Uncharacterized protein n=1 Tax=Gloeophyllum trabeum (strain ATCC 11539 / FP-39264 / Madison 617) TaxID=670483 RepID=S7Q1E9_GLOTA|nr:uncharacterized protein GLOTRDRAFT_131604 [Gloeophyllum trabeum ATCC 11539]EPQ53337.1 hypothetical protein GLOTRDRAFT_131604 [Gloeophyllum trabeum ATCC 11539]
MALDASVSQDKVVNPASEGSAVDATKLDSGLRYCTVCSKLRIPVADDHKMCTSCRDKYRRYYHERKKRPKLDDAGKKPDQNVAAAVSAKLSESDATTPDAASAHPCTRCQKPVAGGGRSCERCREYYRTRHRVRKSKIDSGNLGASRNTPDFAQNNTIPSGNSDASLANEVPADEDDAAMAFSDAQMEHEGSDDSSDVYEYQWETQLFQTLKILVKRSSLSQERLFFSGCYAILRDPHVDWSTSVQKTAVALRKLTGLRFAVNRPVFSRRDANYYRCMYICECRKPADVPHDIHPSQDDQFPTPPAPTIGSPCRGLVTICAQYDDRHPSGLPGEKIIIRIHHPA